MFKVGDKVVCPMRGCGIVETIEERVLLDNAQEYFIIKMLNSNMTVMIPTAKLSASHFRLISDLPTAENALCSLSKKTVEPNNTIPAKERFKNNMAKITSGSLKDYAQVVRDLTHIQKTKVLNAGEKTMLTNARKFLVDEMSLIKDIPQDQVNTMLDSLLN